MPTNIALTGLTKDLAMRAATSQPIRIGLVGTGDMGTDIVSRVAQMQGIAIGAISELKPGAARKSVEIAYGNSDLVAEVTTANAAKAAIEAVRVAVTDNVQALLDAGLIDVVVDATGIPAVGAEIGLSAIERGKHLVMMNGEADVTIGAYLRSEAERLGVVYSLGAGDEPSYCMELVEFVSAMGHRIISAGKGKNNPLNFDATPDANTEEAVRRHMNPRMLVEFVDGSKTMVEMAAIANATGLTPDKPGMHGPACPREDLTKVLSRDSLLGQRMCFSFEVQGGDGVVDGSVEGLRVGEGLVGEVMGFKVAPDGFDSVEFGRVFGQPFDAQPMVAGGERGPGRLAGMDRAVVEHDDHGALALAGFGAVVMIQLFQKGDEVGAALGFGGGNDQPTVAPVEAAHHRALFGLAGGLDAQVCAAFGPGTCKRGMAQRRALVGNQQHDVADCGLCLA